MTAIYNVGPRSTGTDNSTTQSLLQNSYFIAAVAIVLALIILRIIVLRWRQQTLSDFFRIGSRPQYAYGTHPPNDSNYGSMFHGLQLAPVPAAYHSDRRVRGADTDANGRRLDSAGENWNGKDALPAYDNFDRPPKYVEAGWTHGGPSLPMEQSAMTPSPEGEQSGVVHSNTADEAPVYNVDQLGYHTHAVADVAHGTEAPPPLTHHAHDLSSS